MRTSDVKTRSLRYVLWVGAGVVSLLIVLALVLIDQGFITTSAPDLNESELPQTEVQTVAENATRVQDEPEEVTVEEIGLAVSSRDIPDDVWELCGRDAWPKDYENGRSVIEKFEFSEECQIALEEHILQSNPLVFSSDEFSFVLQDNPMTYYRAFSDPAGDLEKIMDALSRPECLLEDGVVANWELKDSCHAEAFTNYAAFYGAHYQSPTSESLLTVKYPEVFDKVPWLLTEHWESYFKLRTLEQIIRKQNYDASLEFSAKNYPSQFQQVISFGESREQDLRRGGEYKDEDQAYILYRTLLLFGARLGDVDTTFRLTSHFDEKLAAYFIEHQPWLENWDEPDRNRIPSESQLLKALNIIDSVADTDVKLDWDGLVKRVCKPDLVQGVSSHPSCQTLISDVLKKLDPTEDRKLKALDQFERKAIELGLYN